MSSTSTQAGDVTIRFFAGAKAAVGSGSQTRPVADGRSIAAVLERVAEGAADPMRARHVFEKCSFLVNGVAAPDNSVALSAGDLLDVLPPFAGG